MDDQRVPGGALLGGKDRSDRVGRERVGAKAIDGLGGEGDQAAFAEELDGAGDVGWVGCVEMEGRQQGADSS